ncbi:hypothetical protein Goklo_006700 [Gossypium klotzschianum]|uniref:RNase H type-1 domain-containing protein n=1 Tax=Gossypium klotzschianum TaxID=34286 RepID=A0A7J8VIJ0_9ROSI|nr:hypothetical protein [Gossypium klotzschianum]
MEETDESIVGVEEDEEDFRSYCEDEDVWKETEGVGSANSPVIQVQKKLDFYVDESVVDYLALMDGLTAAMQNKIRTVYAFADSPLLYDQCTRKNLDNPLLLALRERILELAHNLEEFVLKLTPSINLLRPLQLAQVAIGVISSPAKGDKSLDNCSICFVPVPIRCPHLRCKYYISTVECRSFLPLSFYESLEMESTVLIGIVLSCLTLVNACQLGLVHLLNRIIAELSAQFVEGLYVWNVEFHGICQRVVKSIKTSLWRKEMLQTLHCISWHRTRDGNLATSTFLFAALESSNRPVYQGLSLNGNLVGMQKKGVAGKWLFMLRWSLGVGTLFGASYDIKL